MEVTLFVEVDGRVMDRPVPCKYEEKEVVAAKLHRLHPGKKVTVFYTVGSKMNNQPVEEGNLLTIK